MRVGCWKLVCVVATPACCYGNRQISFQGQAGGPWHSSGTPGGGGWDGNTEFVLVSALPSLPAGLWDTCCYLWAVGVSWKSSQRAALLRAGKLLKPLSRAEKFIHAWISVEGLLLLPKSQAQLCRLWDPLEMPCGQCTAPGSCLPSVRRQELQTGHWSGKQGTGTGDPGHSPCPWELWAKGNGRAGSCQDAVHSPWVWRWDRGRNPSGREQGGGCSCENPFKMQGMFSGAPVWILLINPSVLELPWDAQWMFVPSHTHSPAWMFSGCQHLPKLPFHPCFCHCQGLT